MTTATQTRTAQTQALLARMDAELARRGITRKAFTVEANGHSGTVVAYNARAARRAVARHAGK